MEDSEDWDSEGKGSGAFRLKEERPVTDSNGINLDTEYDANEEEVPIWLLDERAGPSGFKGFSS